MLTKLIHEGYLMRIEVRSSEFEGPRGLKATVLRALEQQIPSHGRVSSGGDSTETVVINVVAPLIERARRLRREADELERLSERNKNCGNKWD